MTAWRPGAKTVVAGVVGRPVDHSLSPLIHNRWIQAAGLDAVYLAFSPSEAQFPRFIEGLRGGVIRGVNVTLPFKEQAITVADHVAPRALDAGAANLLVFEADGSVAADNTDGEGLVYAFRRQASGLDFQNLTVVILGAGGAARGAASTLSNLGVRELRIVNRSPARAQTLATGFAASTVWSLDNFAAAAAGADVVINATSSEVAGGGGLGLDFSTAPKGAIVMDMVYRPLQTQFLLAARRAGLAVVDGLDMLIGQAIPSFQRLFGVAPSEAVDVRALTLNVLEPDG